MGHAVSRQLVSELLAAAGYSLLANRKTREGPQHPDRDAQFRYINQQVRRVGRRLQGRRMTVAAERPARARPSA